MTRLRSAFPVVVTLAMVALGLAGGIVVWRAYMDSPWTRDGRVRSRIVQATPDVSGVVVDLRVADNQRVTRGEVLFVVDPARYRLAVQQSEASVAGRLAELDQRRKEAERRSRLTTAAITEEAREQAANAADTAEAAWRQATAELDVARLNLQRTEVRSTVNGYVTNLLLDRGDYATAGKSAVAVVDSDSFFVAGYFEETKLPRIHVGDPVAVRLMGVEPELSGRVDSIARAIVDRDNVASGDLIANVNPSFSWVRLAQRVPVRVRLDRLPDGVELTSGMTATVVVNPGASAWSRWWNG